MDNNIAEIAIGAFLQQISERLDGASGIAKAVEACADAGNITEAVEIALDVELQIYEATTLLNAASLIRRLAET